jgi:hypothetical protein
MADIESQTGPEDEDWHPGSSVDAAVESGGAAATRPAEGEEPGQDVRGALLAELARAMHDAAAASHARALEAVDRRSAAYVEGIRERAAADAEAVREQANHDIAGVQDWADAEIKRIRAERERRTQARRAELEAVLEERDAQVEWQIGAIEAAVVNHRADLDAFFERLRSETDVTEIARLAQGAPRLPELDVITAAASSRASAAAGSWEEPAARFSRWLGEPEVVGIMAADDAAEPSPLDLGATPNASEASDEQGEASAAPAPTPATPGSVLQAIPSLRPVAARLDRDEEDEKAGR